MLRTSSMTVILPSVLAASFLLTSHASADLVRTSHGLMDRRCVHQVAKGAFNEENIANDCSRTPEGARQHASNHVRHGRG
jgi:hypothetical protein